MRLGCRLEPREPGKILDISMLSIGISPRHVDNRRADSAKRVANSQRLDAGTSAAPHSSKLPAPVYSRRSENIAHAKSVE